MMSPDITKYPPAADSGFIVRFRLSAKTTCVSLVGRLNGIEFPMVNDIPVPGKSGWMVGDSTVTTYHDWIRIKEPDLFWREEEIAAGKLNSLPNRPLISVILPTYNTPPYFLRRCLESVIDQIYSNWQLCVADDQSPNPPVFSALQQYAQKDRRFHLQRSAHQGGISAASNLALASANGEFVVLLDHDDELHPHALLELVRAINEFPDAQFFYSDEDKIDRIGIRSQPAFKPDFDPNIFCSFNYLGHMIALKRSLVSEIGGFRSSCDGAQDWDLLLRATEKLPPSAVQHITKPLYHWRMHDDSTSQNLDAKPYVSKAWSCVLEEHVKRVAKPTTVTEGLFHGSMRLRYSVPRSAEVGVFLRPQDGVFQEAVVRTNVGRRHLHLYHSIGGAVFEMSAQKCGQMAAAANGSSQCQPTPSLCSLTEIKGDVFVFINGPLESVNHLFFEELIAQAMRDDCVLVTGITLDCGNQILASGFVRVNGKLLLDPYVGASFPKHGYMGQINVVRTLDACPDTYFAVRRQHLARIGGVSALSPSLLDSLSRLASETGQSILATPYAVATFSDSRRPRLPMLTSGSEVHPPVRLNPQIFSFAHPEKVLQGILE